MGWTWTDREKGQSLLDFFKETFDHEHGCLIDGAVLRRKTFYGAYEISREGKKQVIGFVVMLGYAPRSCYNQGYK